MHHITRPVSCYGGRVLMLADDFLDCDICTDSSFINSHLVIFSLALFRDKHHLLGGS